MKSTPPPLRVGVIGVGTMGRHHVRICSSTPDVTLAGIFDADSERAFAIGEQYGCTSFRSLGEMLDRVDAVTVASPTSTHVDVGTLCLERAIHVLVEKPLAHTVPGAEQLVELARRNGAVLMVGHIERYNPATAVLMDTLKQEAEQPVSIVARRLAPFDGSRCMDVDVLLDLLIHDMDLALDIAQSPVARVSAVGRRVYSDQVDEAHARIEYANGSTATFWTARCSARKVRTLTVTTRSRYIEADLLNRTLVLCKAQQLPSLDEGVCLMGEFVQESPTVPDEEPLRRELDEFFRAVRGQTKPTVDGARALAAMKAVEMVAESIAQGGEIIRAER